MNKKMEMRKKFSVRRRVGHLDQKPNAGFMQVKNNSGMATINLLKPKDGLNIYVFLPVI